jgi:regulator of protease activity HflC (stomatin/prohibitin superfamily)
MSVSSKPAERVSWASLILSVVFFGVAFFVGRWSGFFVVSTVGWFIGSSVLIWFVLCLQFHARSLAEQEKLDMSQLAEKEKASTIFQAKGERTALFAVAQRRLQLFEKWFLPVFSVVIAVYQIGIGGYLLDSISASSENVTKQPLICAICMTAIAFISFLISRYATGMSAQLQWKPLRAGGSYFLGSAFLCFALAISLALTQFKIFVALSIINYVIVILLIVLGIETALNIVFDIYRPRIKGQYSRGAFDSRLLGIINEPGQIFRTAASAIDYQFGFKVSQTWFYKLLEKAVVPLVLFAIGVLYLLSCIVIVAPNEEGIIEHFGNPLYNKGVVRHIGPGLTFKWPWPIDIVYKYPTKKVSEVNIGFVHKRDEKTGEVVREPLLWGKAHYKEEYSVLVASEQIGENLPEGAVPVSLLVANLPVQYRVKDLYAFVYNHKEPQQILESICYRELARFVASAQIEVDDEDDIEHSLLGMGRSEAQRILTERIQWAADEADLGVEIVFLGLQGIHPPPDVAGEYQQVVGAVQKKQATVLNAHAERNAILSALAGSVESADELYELAARYQRAEENNDKKQLAEISADLDLAFGKARGDIFSTLRQAQSYAFEKSTIARATGERFSSQLKAYKAAEEIYKHQQRLVVFEQALKKVRKFIVVADEDDTQVFMVDVQEKLTPSLYELSGLEERK